MRFTKVLAGAVAALVLVAAAALPSSARSAHPARSAQPAPDAAPVATALPVSAFAPISGLALRAVDPNTGLLYTADDAAHLIRVYEPDGTAVATVPMYAQGQPVAGPVFTSGAVFFVTRGTVERYDPETVASTGTWVWEPSGFFPSPAFALRDGVIWQDVPVLDGPRANHLFATATEQVSYVGTDQLTSVTANGGVIGEISWNVDAGTSSLSIRTGINDRDSLTLPYDRLNGLAIAADGSGAVVRDDAAHVLRELTILTNGHLAETSATYPFEGTVVSVAVGPAPARAVAVETKVGDAPSVLSIFRSGRAEPVARAEGFGAAPLAFSPDGTTAYRNRNGAIEVIDLAPKLGAPTPTLVGRAGGAGVSVPYKGVAPVGVNIGDVAAPFSADADTLQTFVPPRLPVGPATVQVIGGLDSVEDAPVPLRVVELGPFATVPGFVGRQYGDVLGRMPTVDEVRAATADLEAGGLAGDLPAELVRSRPLTAKDASLIRLYRAVFQRLPDTAGYRYWLARLDGGTTLVRAAATFAGSSEFQRTYGELRNGAFVDLVYQNVLGRAPDPSGRAYWLRKLSAGTSRGTLVAQFSQSSEYVTKTTALVERVRLVAAMFDRMPKQSELDFVASMGLEQVAQSLLTALQYPTS